MCDPMSLLMVSAGGQAGGQVLAGESQYQSSKAEARMLESTAAATRDAGQQTARKIRQRGEQTRGAAVATFGASGVKIGEGSALDAERYIAQGYEEDAAMTILNASRQAVQYENQASVARSNGRAARLAGFMRGANSLLSAGMQSPNWRA